MYAALHTTPLCYDIRWHDLSYSLISAFRSVTIVRLFPFNFKSKCKIYWLFFLSLLSRSKAKSGAFTTLRRRAQWWYFELFWHCTKSHWNWTNLKRESKFCELLLWLRSDIDQKCICMECLSTIIFFCDVSLSSSLRNESQTNCV